MTKKLPANRLREIVASGVLPVSKAKCFFDREEYYLNNPLPTTPVPKNKKGNIQYKSPRNQTGTRKSAIERTDRPSHLSESDFGTYSNGNFWGHGWGGSTPLL